MVNEINKPPSSDNIMLGERLAASNRQLQEMQEEHRQLLQEMHMLRRRAAELTRLNAQELDDSNNTDAEAVEHSTIQAPTTTNNPPTVTLDAQAERSSASPSHSAAPHDAPAVAATQSSEDNKDEDDENPEAAAYLQEKLAELAALKAQFSRVKTMINTTELIETHLADKSGNADTNTPPPAVNRTPNANNPNTTAPNESATDAASSSSLTANVVNADAHSENQELLSSMMNMFTDFTSDLRNQAEELRAERDRIRALKEDHMRARMGK